MSRTPDEQPIRLNVHHPRFAACPDCRRSKSDYLPLLEAHRKFGYASTNCVTCGLTVHRRRPPEAAE